MKKIADIKRLVFVAVLIFILSVPIAVFADTGTDSPINDSNVSGEDDSPDLDTGLPTIDVGSGSGDNRSSGDDYASVGDAATGSDAAMSDAATSSGATEPAGAADTPADTDNPVDAPAGAGTTGDITADAGNFAEAPSVDTGTTAGTQMNTGATGTQTNTGTTATPMGAGPTAAPTGAGPTAAPTGAGPTAAPTGAGTSSPPVAQAYEIPEGSAYVAGHESIVYRNNASANAIQQAIDAAIAFGQKASTDSITVVVNHGTYRGGIMVTGDQARAAAKPAGTTAIPIDGFDFLDLNIIAHDAFAADKSGNIPVDDDGEFIISSESAGGVQLEGGLTVDSVNLMLAGIYLSMQEQKKTESDLAAAGAAASADPFFAMKDGLQSNEIRVRNANTFTWYGTALGDDVLIDLTNIEESIAIDSGAGDDKIRTRVNQRVNYTYDTSAGTIENLEANIDAILENLTTDGQNGLTAAINEIAHAVTDNEGNIVSYNDSRLELEVSTGAGDDELELIFVNATEIVIPDNNQSGSTGGGTTNPGGGTTNPGGGTTNPGGGTAQRNILVNVDLSASNVNIDTGEGADSVTIAGRSKLSNISTVVLQPLINSVYELATDLSQGTTTTNGDRVLPQTEITIDGGTGDDLYTIDSTLAFTTFRGVDLTLIGDEEAEPYFDRVHLTGKVGDSPLDAGDNRLTYDAATNTLGMMANAEVTLLNGGIPVSDLYAEMNLILDKIDAVTDILRDKVEVKATMAEMASIEFKSFRNYIIQDYVGKNAADVLTSFVNNSGSDTLLTNLCIESYKVTCWSACERSQCRVVLPPGCVANINVEGDVTMCDE